MAHTPGEGWQAALKRLRRKVGKTFKDGAYALDSIDAAKHRFLFSRVATGSPVVVTAAKLDRCWEATADGTLAWRKNAPEGISYTVADQLLIAYALGLQLDAEKRWTR